MPPMRKASATGSTVSGSFHPRRVAISPSTGDEEGDDQLGEVITVLRVIEARQKIHDPPPVDEDDRKDRARLDGDIEQLRALPEPALRDQQVPGARDGQELSDAFDDAEKDGIQGVGHERCAFTGDGGSILPIRVRRGPQLGRWLSKKVTQVLQCKTGQGYL